MTPLAVATLAALALITLAAGIYATLCRELPFKPCRRCQGTGTRTIPGLFGHKLRACRTCRGTGTRLRTGRALYNHARRIHTEATTTTLPPQRDPKQPPHRPGW